MILGLFGELMTYGGIQGVGRHTAAVLSSFAKDRNQHCCLYSLNDPPGYHSLKVGDSTLAVKGFGRRKGRFVLAVLAAAPRTYLAYIGHPYLAPLGLLLRILRPSSRYLVATHGIDVWERLAFFRRLGLRSAHTVTTVSRFTAEKMAMTQKLKPGMIKVIPPALDHAFCGMNAPVSYPRPPIPAGKVLLTVARLAASEQYKGFDAVIQALPTVLREVPDSCYVIVGDGDDRPRLERLASDVGVADHVLFVGQVDNELASYYDACDVFVMPSRAEGFGIVFLEAMIFGKPVIGGNHGGIPEVVIDGVTGFLVDHGDVNTLAHHLIRLLQDEALRRRMGEAGRRRAEENYTFERFHRTMIQILS